MKNKDFLSAFQIQDFPIAYIEKDEDNNVSVRDVNNKFLCEYPILSDIFDKNTEIRQTESLQEGISCSDFIDLILQSNPDDRKECIELLSSGRYSVLQLPESKNKITFISPDMRARYLDRSLEEDISFILENSSPSRLTETISIFPATSQLSFMESVESFATVGTIFYNWETDEFKTSKGISELIGMEIPDIFTYREFRSLFVMDDVRYFEKMIIDTLTNNKTGFTTTIRLKKVENRIKWVEYSLAFIYRENRATSFIGMLKDITKQKESMEELELLYDVIGALSEFVILFHEEGIIEFANKALEDLLGFNKQELCTKSIFDLIGDQMNQQSWEILWNDVKEKRRDKSLWSLSKKDGSLAMIESSLTHIYYHEEEYIIAIGKDITNNEEYKQIKKLAETTNNISLKLIDALNIYTKGKAKRITLSELGLTKKQIVVVHEVLSGKKYKEIANHLAISLPTLKNHLSIIYRKMNVENRIELINYISNQNIKIE